MKYQYGVKFERMQSIPFPEDFCVSKVTHIHQDFFIITLYLTKYSVSEDNCFFPHVVNN
jgi:hypothetical protein